MQIAEENLSKFKNPHVPLGKNYKVFIQASIKAFIQAFIRDKVSTKLKQVTVERIIKKGQEEQKLTGWASLSFKIEEIFERIGQFFKGHSLRTKEEWGIELAGRIIALEAPNKTENLTSWLNNVPTDKLTLVLNCDPLKDRLVSLSKKDKEYIFDNLNQSHRSIFVEELIQKNWGWHGNHNF